VAVAADDHADELGVLAERATRVGAPVLDAVPGPIDGGQHDRQSVHIQRQPWAVAAEIVQ
jgi:hypothetical protein